MRGDLTPGKKEKPETPRPTGRAALDPDSLQTEEIRSLGPEILAVDAWEQMGVSSVLAREGFTPREQALVCALTVGRLVAPGSERATHRFQPGDPCLRGRSGFQLLLEQSFEFLDATRFEIEPAEGEEDAGAGALLRLDGFDELMGDVVLAGLPVPGLAGADEHFSSGRGSGAEKQGQTARQPRVMPVIVRE